jgi:hypothetical protein
MSSSAYSFVEICNVKLINVSNSEQTTTRGRKNQRKIGKFRYRKEGNGGAHGGGKVDRLESRYGKEDNGGAHGGGKIDRLESIYGKEGNGGVH